MSQYQLAQLNIAHLLAPIDSPVLADFVNNLDRINGLAEAAPGFVWRLQTAEGDATAIKDFGEDYLVNMSVWQDVETLHTFVYQTAHAEIMSRRKQWFARIADAYSVLWWIKAGHRPDTAEARLRLDLLQQQGPTAQAFTFKRRFPSPEAR